MTDATYKAWPGATPEDWSFLVSQGLVADLLPVVSDTSAKVSEGSKMRDLGKTPSRFNREGFVVGIPAWTQHHSTERQVRAWSNDPRLGICLQTRTVRCLDIDIADGAVAQEIVELVEMMAGPMPRRWRANSGKCLLPFVCTGELTKRILRTQHGAVELLATGQQFIAFGTHPSGERYQWHGLDAVEVAGFPEWSLAELEAVWETLAAAHGQGEEVVRQGVRPSVPRSKLDMHGDPVVAFLAENSWVREYDRDGRVHVRCPWEHEHTSDSGPSATSWFPAGVGGFAQGHFKCLHAHCAGRTDNQFLEAIGYEAAMFEVVELNSSSSSSSTDELPWPVLVRDKQGRIEGTMDNCVQVLARPDICGARIAFDEFKGTTMVGWSDTWRPLQDVDYTTLRVALERRGFKACGKELVRDAVHKVADEHRFDSAIEWLDGLQWDGVPRVETFFSRLVGVADSAYSRAVGLYLWSALAGRVLRPGVKVDMVPVLIGGQGVGKTSLVEALVPAEDAFVEINLETRDDNLARSLRGKLVGELAELRGLASREAEAIKAWISRRVEEWTPKYQEHVTSFPRRLVLIGTGNNPEFLDDDTGERRWLPLEVGRADLAALREERDQLWAEGAVLFREHGVHWQQAQALAVHEHAAFKAQDPWADPIERWLADTDMDLAGAARGDASFTMEEVLVGALRLDTARMGRRDLLRAGKVLRALGYEKRDVRVAHRVVKKWARVSGH